MDRKKAYAKLRMARIIRRFFVPYLYFPVVLLIYELNDRFVIDNHLLTDKRRLVFISIITTIWFISYVVSNYYHELKLEKYEEFEKID